MHFNPWHSISYGENSPASVNTIIEIQRGSKAKYELDKLSGLLRLDRILQTDLNYPFHYGFIPQTYAGDNDPLDILVICSQPLVPLTIVEARVLGAVHMIDGGEQDDKIIAVAENDHVFANWSNLSDVPADELQTIKHFFEVYKKLEKKKVIVKDFLTKEESYGLILESIEGYKKVFTR